VTHADTTSLDYRRCPRCKDTLTRRTQQYGIHAVDAFREDWHCYSCGCDYRVEFRATLVEALA
jgi:uncharacterized protein with PIN domain